MIQLSGYVLHINKGGTAEVNFRPLLGMEVFLYVNLFLHTIQG